MVARLTSKNIQRMKNFLTYLTFLILFSACQDFLEEEMVATLTQDRYNTSEGLEELVNGAYEGLRFHHNYEWSYVMTNYGTDEFTNGGGVDHVIWNTYLSTLDPTEARNLKPFWDNLYAQINLCNIGIKKIPEVLADDQDVELRNTRLGEVLFLRGFNYLKLVEQFAGVPVSLAPVESDLSEFPRVPAGEVMKVILTDLRAAADLLPTEAAQTGRITQATAHHFLAKAYLFRASERNQEFTASTDLDSAIFFAEQTIGSPNHELATDYHDLFNYTAVNGPNETNSEVILASQFNDNQSLIGRFGNQTHLYFLSVYRTFPGMTRDLANGREFQRLRPTDYAMDIYDRKNDSRFYKSFKTAFMASVESEDIPKWTVEQAPSPELIGERKFGVGDTAIVYVVNHAGDPRFTVGFKDSFAPLLLARYAYDSLGTPDTDWNPSTYPSLSKYLDPFRQSSNDARGTRDGLLARLGETYLIAAEAYGRKGDYGQALVYINALRTRAAYKEAEERSPVYYLAEQVTTGEPTSTETEMLVTEESFTQGTAAALKELYPAGISSQQELFIHFILNERARELMGEFHRWVDLSRTGTLLIRARAFNPEAALNISAKHLLRPIPQSYLDAVTSGGSLLTPEQKAQAQNEGW